jgi:hypothetical protein
VLAARDARVAWQEAVARAAGEPVRHRGLSRGAADAAQEAVAALGRAAMLLEAHLPDRGHAPVAGAAELAVAVRAGTAAGARAVRERRVPEWDGVRAVLAGWDAPEGSLLRCAAGQVMEALDEVSEALRP